MKLLVFPIILLSLSIEPVQAGLIDQIKESIRPFVIEVLGAEKATEILGSDPNSIKLPLIPEIDKSATNVAKLPEEKKINISKKDKKRYNIAFIKEVFPATRKVEANENDLAKWMNVMSQGASREGVYRALVLDNLYAGLENYKNPITEEVIDFTIEFYSRFLERLVTKDKLDGVNFYTLKRMMVERTLELVDAFILKNELDFHKWYAVFSSEMAEKFPAIFKSEIRKDMNAKRHLIWAQNVPRQHIKSEVIIKIHKIFNHLMP